MRRKHKHSNIELEESFTSIITVIRIVTYTVHILFLDHDHS